MSEVAGHLWACMNVYSIAAKRAIPKTFAICFPCFSKLTRLSRPDSNVFAGEEELLLKHVMKEGDVRAKVPRGRWTWKGCIVCRSPWTGRTLNKDPGYEVRNMLYVW